jgi:formylmethanofuran dehydrogenase subunit E
MNEYERRIFNRHDEIYSEYIPEEKEETKGTCDCCGSVIHRPPLYVFSLFSLCPECLEKCKKNPAKDPFIKCEECGEEIGDEDLYEIDGRFFCGDCVRSHRKAS